MKFLLLFAIFLNMAFSNDLKVGNRLDFTYEDQFEKSYSLQEDTKKLIFIFSKDNGHKLKDFLATQKSNFLESKKTLYVADISGMPSIIYSLFAKGDMQDLPYRVMMIHDKDISKKYKTEQNKEKFVVVTLQNKKIINIVERDDVETTIKELDK